MPSRQLAAKELADIFKLMAHPDRIRLIEELRFVEMDVNSLCSALGLPGPRVSQHLSLLRAHRLVADRREGRHHYYRLVQPEIANWIVEGLAYVEGRAMGALEQNIEHAKRLWARSPEGELS